MNVTKLEMGILNWMANHEMTCTNGWANGAECASDCATYLWVDEIAESLDITMNATKGVLSSLVQKGLVILHSSADPTEAMIDMTDTAFKIWREAYPVSK